MDSPASKMVGLAGLFDSPEPLLRAAEAFRDAGFKNWDCHTPYPVHGLDRAMGLRGSPIGWVMVPAAFTGLACAVALTGGLDALAYPVRIGGKPMFSWQAFVPIFFELFVLAATVATMAALVIFCKLGRWHSPLHDSDLARHVTRDRFAVIVRTDRPGPGVEAARRILEAAGCVDIQPLIEFEEAASEKQ